MTPNNHAGQHWYNRTQNKYILRSNRVRNIAVCYVDDTSMRRNALPVMHWQRMHITVCVRYTCGNNNKLNRFHMTAQPIFKSNIYTLYLQFVHLNRLTASVVCRPCVRVCVCVCVTARSFVFSAIHCQQLDASCCQILHFKFMLTCTASDCLMYNVEVSH